MQKQTRILSEKEVIQVFKQTSTNSTNKFYISDEVSFFYEIGNSCSEFILQSLFTCNKFRTKNYRKDFNWFMIKNGMQKEWARGIFTQIYVTVVTSNSQNLKENKKSRRNNLPEKTTCSSVTSYQWKLEKMSKDITQKIQRHKTDREVKNYDPTN